MVSSVKGLHRCVVILFDIAQHAQRYFPVHYFSLHFHYIFMTFSLHFHIWYYRKSKPPPLCCNIVRYRSARAEVFSRWVNYNYSNLFWTSRRPWGPISFSKGEEREMAAPCSLSPGRGCDVDVTWMWSGCDVDVTWMWRRWVFFLFLLTPAICLHACLYNSIGRQPEICFAIEASLRKILWPWFCHSQASEIIKKWWHVLTEQKTCCR
jgi:hypothetical protein